MRPASSSHFGVYSFLLLPIMFLIWSISLNLSMNRQQKALSDNAKLLTSLSALEQSLGEVGRVEVGRVVVDDRPAIARDASEVLWQQLQTNYRAKRAAIDVSDPGLRDIRQFLIRADSSVDRMDTLFAAMRPLTSDTSKTDMLEREFRATSHRAFDNVKAAGEMVQARLTIISDDLLSKWQYLSILVWVSCLLTSLLAVLVVMYRGNVARFKRTDKALRDSEERYRRLVELSPEAIAVHCEGKVVYINAAGVQLLGATSPEDLIGKPALAFVHPGCRQKVEKRIRQIYEKEKKTRLEEEKFVRLDGQVIDVEVAAVPIRYQGKPAAQVVIRDITGRKRAEESLRKSETMYRTLVNTAPSAVTVTDLEGNITFVSQRTVEIHGCKSPDDLLGKSAFALIASEDHQSARENLEKTLAHGSIQNVEYTLLRLDGSRFVGELNASVVRDTEGNPTAFVGTTRDITERKQAERALRESENTLSRFASAVTDVIYRYDPSNNRYDFISPSFELQTGYTVEEIAADPAGVTKKITHPDDAERVFKDVDDHIKKGPCTEPFCTEYRVIKKDGQLIWVSDRKDIEFTADGKVYRINGVVRDITAHKLAEDRIAKLNECFLNFGAEPDKNINSLTALCGKLLDATCALYNRLDGDMLCSLGQWNVPPNYNPVDKPEGHICYDVIRREEEGIFSVHNLQETSYAQSDPNVIPYNLQTYFGQAVKCGDKCLGSLCVVYQTDHDLREEDKKLMAIIASAIGVEEERKRTDEARRASEELLRATVESTADGILVVNEKGQVTHTNTRFAEMWRIPEGLMKTRDDNKLLAFVLEQLEEPQAFLSKVQELYKTSEEGFDTICFKDGRVFERFSCPLIRDQKIAGRVWNFRDITERRQVEEKLQQLAVFPENNPDVVLTLDAKAEILYMNPAAVKVLKEMGLTKDQTRQFLPGNIQQIVAECLSTQKRVTDIEVSLSDKTWDWTFHPVTDQKTVHCYATDITERIKNEAELRKLSAAVVQSANMIAITDPRGIIEYINPQFSRVTGYSLTEAVGKPANLLKSGKQDKDFYKDLWQTIKLGKIWTGNLQNRRKNGGIFWERQTITPVFDEKGRVINFLSVGEDITSEILAQQKLTEADKMSAVGMLAAGVAHEFKNYLAGIIGNASFALSELEEDGGLQLAGETLSKIVELGEKANDVAMSLLSYSKAQPDDLNREDFKKIIKRVISLVEKELKNRSIEIVTYFEKVPQVEVSTSKIQQLLMNLLINAQHAIKSDGVITIALLSGHNHITVKVGDTGVGIPQKNLSRIFDPFFSTKGVWGKDELVGTGMGLAICRNIAREHGGDLSVESLVGAGSTFVLTLPVSHYDSMKRKGSAGTEQEINVIVFTLDKSIVSHYFKQACEINTRIMLIDDIAKLPDDLSQVADLVICDAKFTGKVELYKMVTACRRWKIPYVMINCGMMEYQLAELYENSVANFKQLPEFSRIIKAAEHNSLEVSH